MFNKTGNLSVSVGVMPSILIEKVALEKMKAYVTYCDKEIGWLGTATRTNNAITIHDMFLFEQEVHATTCEINEQAVAKWYEEILTTYPNGVDIVNSMRVWGHSHVNMSVGPSGQDETQFSDLIKSVDDFFIRIIANKKGEMRLDYHDVASNITFCNIDWATELSIDTVSIQKEIKEKVKQKVYVYPAKGKAQLQDVSKSNNGNKRQLTGDWYDDCYENYSTSNQGLKDYNTWEDVYSGEELICDYGFDEESVYDIAQMLSNKEVMLYMEKKFGDAYVIEDEAEHLRNVCQVYINERYGIKK